MSNLLFCIVTFMWAKVTDNAQSVVKFAAVWQVVHTTSTKKKRVCGKKKKKFQKSIADHTRNWEVCLYIYIYMYAYIHLYMHMCMYKCACIHIYTYICMCVCIHIHIYIYVCMHTYIYLCVYACIYIYIYVYVRMHIYMCVYAYIIIIMLRHQHGPPWPSLANRLYRPLLLVSLQDYIRINTDLLYVGSSWSSCLCLSMWRVHKSMSLMILSPLLQQWPECLVRLTWIVFLMGGRWSYSCCFVGCCFQD